MTPFSPPNSGILFARIRVNGKLIRRPVFASPSPMAAGFRQLRHAPHDLVQAGFSLRAPQKPRQPLARPGSRPNSRLRLGPFTQPLLPSRAPAPGHAQAQVTAKNHQGCQLDTFRFRHGAIRAAPTGMSVPSHFVLSPEYACEDELARRKTLAGVTATKVISARPVSCQLSVRRRM